MFNLSLEYLKFGRGFLTNNCPLPKSDALLLVAACISLANTLGSEVALVPASASLSHNNLVAIPGLLAAGGGDTLESARNEFKL